MHKSKSRVKKNEKEPKKGRDLCCNDFCEYECVLETLAETAVFPVDVLDHGVYSNFIPFDDRQL